MKHKKRAVRKVCELPNVIVVWWRWPNDDMTLDEDHEKIIYIFYTLDTNVKARQNVRLWGIYMCNSVHCKILPYRDRKKKPNTHD